MKPISRKRHVNYFFSCSNDISNEDIKKTSFDLIERIWKNEKISATVYVSDKDSEKKFIICLSYYEKIPKLDRQVMKDCLMVNNILFSKHIKTTRIKLKEFEY